VTSTYDCSTTKMLMHTRGQIKNRKNTAGASCGAVGYVDHPSDAVIAIMVATRNTTADGAIDTCMHKRTLKLIAWRRTSALEHAPASTAGRPRGPSHSLCKSQARLSPPRHLSPPGHTRAYGPIMAVAKSDVYAAAMNPIKMPASTYPVDQRGSARSYILSLRTRSGIHPEQACRSPRHHRRSSGIGSPSQSRKTGRTVLVGLPVAAPIQPSPTPRSVMP
jgi:hypothetical protein